MLTITIEQMQGNACGTYCLKVVKEDGTKYGKTLGFVVPIQYNFQGYWGGTAYFVCSFNHPENKHTEEIFHTIFDVAIHLGVDPIEFNNALPHKEGKAHIYQWQYLNTYFCRPLHL